MNPIVAGLLRIVKRIAKWILDVAVRRGGKWLAGYLDERSGVLRRRLARLSKRKSTPILEARLALLRARIAAWRSASKWLDANAGQVDDRVIGLVRDLPAFKKLPDCSEAERQAA